MKDKVLDIIYPRRCPVCDEPVSNPGSLVCRECEGAFYEIREPYCLKCGKPLRDDSNALCEGCMRREHDFARGRAALIYDDILKESVYRFKYGGRREYADYYVDRMAETLGPFVESCAAQAIIPIPLHKSRLKTRGYNQAALLAYGLSKRFNIPVREDILIRSGKTGVQKSLRAGQRQNNLKKAFKIDCDVVKLKNIILVDDIYTTGSTVDAAARLLHDAGVTDVYCAVLGVADID